MEVQKLLIGNRLIAEFMGYKIENKGYQTLEYHSSNESSWVDREGEIVTLNGQEVSDSDNEPYFNLEDLPFNESWDWLMSVVEKIENLEKLAGTVFIIQNHCTIKSNMLGDKTVMSNRGQCYQEENSKLSNSYSAVIEFIEWYNDQK